MTVGHREADTRDGGPWSWLWSAGLVHRFAVAVTGIGFAWLVIFLTIAAD